MLICRHVLHANNSSQEADVRGHSIALKHTSVIDLIMMELKFILKSKHHMETIQYVENGLLTPDMVNIFLFCARHSLLPSEI